MNDTKKVSVVAEEGFRPFARVVAREVEAEMFDDNQKGMFLTLHVSSTNEYDSWG